jgi:hypothetical protein
MRYERKIMPDVDHNSADLVARLYRESYETRRVLQKLRHIVEQGHIATVPVNVMTELGYHATQLANCIRTLTIRHDYVDMDGKPLHSSYWNPLSYVDNAIREDPGILNHIIHDERELYMSLGFTSQEFDGLEAWRRELRYHQSDEFSVERAFNYFVDYVLRDLQAGNSLLRPNDIIPPVIGMVGIGIDVWSFLLTPVVPPLVGSVANGIGAIASKFTDVMRKLTHHN